MKMFIRNTLVPMYKELNNLSEDLQRITETASEKILSDEQRSYLETLQDKITPVLECFYENKEFKNQLMLDERIDEDEYDYKSIETI